MKLPSLSDPVLIRADGTPLYTFTSVVDDLESGVTHIVRGEDHVTNTGVQIDLWEALGGDPAALRFAHLPLLTGRRWRAAVEAPRQPLAAAVAARRDRAGGARRATSRRSAPRSDPVPGMPRDLVERFDLGAVSHSPARFDAQQLLALNRRAPARRRVRQRARPAARGRRRGLLERGARQPRPAARSARSGGRWCAAPSCRRCSRARGEFLRAALDALPPEPWDEATWTGWTGALKDAHRPQGQRAVPAAAPRPDRRGPRPRPARRCCR